MLRLGQGVRGGAISGHSDGGNCSDKDIRNKAIKLLETVFDDVSTQVCRNTRVDDSLLAVRDSLHYVIHRLKMGASFKEVQDVVAFIKDSTGVKLNGWHNLVYKGVSTPLKDCVDIPETPKTTLCTSIELDKMFKQLIDVKSVSTVKKTRQNVFLKRPIEEHLSEISNTEDLTRSPSPSLRSPRAFVKQLVTKAMPITSLRNVSGDGHCFYRAVAVNAAESGQWNKVKTELLSVSSDVSLRQAVEKVDHAVALAQNGRTDSISDVFSNDSVDKPIMNAMRRRVQFEMQHDIEGHGEDYSFSIKDNRRSPVSIVLESLSARWHNILLVSEDGSPAYAEGEDLLYTAKAFKLNLEILNADTSKQRRETLQIEQADLRKSVIRYSYGARAEEPLTLFFRTDHYQIGYRS